MRGVLPGLDVSDDVMSKIAFSYSYHSAQLIFPFCKEVLGKTNGQKTLAYRNATFCADA